MSLPEDDWTAAREQLDWFLSAPEREAPPGPMVSAEQAPVLLDQIIETREVPGALRDAGPLTGRRLLAAAARESVARIPDYPVGAEVKRLLCKEYQFFADPGQGREDLFLPGAPEFREMAATARLKRFIAGLVHWQVSGIPRSWLLRMGWRDSARTLAVVFRAGGFAPFFEAHIPRRGAGFLSESAYRRAYLRIAQSMELQPSIRGIFGSSWLHAEETMRVTPHLAWINRLCLDNGGMLAHMGPAPESSGFLVGSAKRRELYESGEYRPRVALIVWPRAAILEWARRQAPVSS